ncbi:GL16456 [Drosophila persimilis]|uniref:GL16456 n=1 Tax=Drosophila persimilis TaxID=7234 RepID=B4GWF0_DROPE|nr:GL16456 [Drosophila persimilis]
MLHAPAPALPCLLPPASWLLALWSGKVSFCHMERWRWISTLRKPIDGGCHREKRRPWAFLQAFLFESLASCPLRNSLYFVGILVDNGEGFGGAPGVPSRSVPRRSLACFYMRQLATILQNVGHIPPASGQRPTGGDLVTGIIPFVSTKAPPPPGRGCLPLDTKTKLKCGKDLEEDYLNALPLPPAVVWGTLSRSLFVAGIRHGGLPSSPPPPPPPPPPLCQLCG